MSASEGNGDITKSMNVPDLCLPSSIIGFFHGAFQPHLDQMQHASINDPARYRLYEYTP